MRRLKFYWQVLLGLPKSLYINIHYFSWKGLILPIVVSHRTTLKNVKGRVEVNQYKFAQIRLGFSDVALSSGKEWNVWNVRGRIVFGGVAYFGKGAKIYVGHSGTLMIGNNFMITARSEIICSYHIIFSDDALISWDVLIMDTDSHPVRNKENCIINNDKPIIIAKNVWIGARSIILKGTRISENSIIAAGSLLNKQFNQPAVIIAGSPATIIKKEIVWLRESF